MSRKSKAKRPKLTNGHNKQQEILDSGISKIVEAMGSSAGAVTLWDADQHQPSHSSTFGLSPEDFERLRPMIDEALPALEGGSTATQALVPLEQEASHLRVSGRDGPLRMFALPLRSQGRLAGLLCLFNTPEQIAPIRARESAYEVVIDQVDVVYQNARLLQRLMEEKRWLEGVIRSSADAILIVDHDCRIVGFNPAWERLTGWRVEEVRGRSCHEVFEMRTITGVDSCESACPLRMAKAGSEAVSSAEVHIQRRDGSDVPVETSYALIQGEEGECLGGVVSARDISARKEAEALQSTFLSVISHELQTPIAIIKGYAGLLSEQGAMVDTSQLKQKLSVIQEESERLSKMVENLLSASRIQAGGMEMRREPTELGSLIRRVVQKMRNISSQHTLSTRIPRDLPLVFVDYERVHEVVANLIENALKYSPNGGTIRISAHATAGELIVRVRDQGIGVPDTEKERIFQPFSRLDSRLVREVKGAGLGLFICKAIVEAHGGQIWVETPGGGGACFAFSLPTERRMPFDE